MEKFLTFFFCPRTSLIQKLYPWMLFFLRQSWKMWKYVCCCFYPANQTIVQERRENAKDNIVGYAVIHFMLCFFSFSFSDGASNLHVSIFRKKGLIITMKHFTLICFAPPSARKTHEAKFSTLYFFMWHLCFAGIRMYEEETERSAPTSMMIKLDEYFLNSRKKYNFSFHVWFGVLLIFLLYGNRGEGDSRKYI